jgi:hypothetical protein
MTSSDAHDGFLDSWGGALGVRAIREQLVWFQLGVVYGAAFLQSLYSAGDTSAGGGTGASLACGSLDLTWKQRSLVFWNK